MQEFVQLRNGIVTGTYRSSDGGCPTEGLPEGEAYVAVPEGLVGRSLLLMAYDKGTKSFIDTPESTARANPPKSNKVSKVAFLGVIPPALYKAWATSSDPILMYGKALFDADTSVDITNPAIAAVFAQAVVLQLIDAPTAAALLQKIAGLVG